MSSLIVFETERTNVRYLQTSAAAFILKLLNSEGWLKNIGDRKVYDIPAAEIYLKDRVIFDYPNGFGLYGIELKETGELVGTTGLIDRPGLDGIDVGFAMLDDQAGKGYGYEATFPVIGHARNLGIKKLLAITLPSNLSSRKLLEKLGFSLEKEFYMDGDPELLCLYTQELK